MMKEVPPLKVYGVNACDTVKKARVWLAQNDVAHDFIDFKKTPPSAAQLQAWLGQLPWERLINRKGTTWRKLTPEAQAHVRDAASATALALESPSVIKRPLVEWPDGQVTVGFDAEAWAARRASKG